MDHMFAIVMHAVCITHWMCPSSMENEPSYTGMLSTCCCSAPHPVPIGTPDTTPEGTRAPRSETSVIECLLGR